MEDKTPLRRLYQYGRVHRNRVYLATLFSVLNKLFDLAPPILIGIAIDVLVNPATSEISGIANWLGFEGVMAQLWIVAALTLLVWALESICEYVYKLQWRNLAQSLQHEMRMDVYEHVQSLELAYFEDQSTGGLMSVLNNDVNELERFLDVGANDIVQLIVTILFIGSWFLFLAPGVAWMAVLPMPFLIWGSIRFQRFLQPLYLAVREKVSLLNSQLSNNLSGIATIKSFTAEEHEVERIRQRSAEYQRSNEHAIRLSSAFVPLIRMVIVPGFILTLVYGGRLVARGALEVGLYSSMVYMTQRLLWPLTRLGETLDQYQRAMASLRRLFKLLDTPVNIVDGPHQLPLSEVRGAIRFEGAEFAYADSAAVLHGLDLDIPAGETIAIVGATGAGKSTIIKLMLRFYDVKAGRVTLDGHDVRDLPLADLRRSIGLVSQDVYLFHGTVRENIEYGAPGASLEAIVEAAKIAEAHAFIQELPHGYETVVGERGQKLSGGQRQRLSIARAVLKDPPVLILDEATSSVDNETEAAIQRSLDRIVVDRTTIVIAHRLSTVRNADKIYVMEQGRVVEEGRHDELVAAGGIYADLWRIQTGELLLKGVRAHG